MKTKWTNRVAVAAVLVIVAGARGAIEIQPPSEPPPPAAGGAAPAGPEARGGSAGAGRLEMINGDRMTGTLESMDPAAGTLVLRHPSVRDPMTVALPAVDSYTAAPGAPAPEAGPWTVELSNGDELKGGVRALAADKLELDTWYSGRVQVARPMIRALHQGGGATIYEGPGDDETGWVAGRGALTLRDGALIMGNNQIVGRELPSMPKRARIDVELRWMAYSYIMIHLYADKPASQDGSGGAYILSFQGNQRLEMSRMTPNQGTRRLGIANLPGMESESQQFQVRFSIFCDVEKRTFAVWVNDRAAAEFQDPQAFEGTGRALTFFTMQSPQTEVRNIAVRAWDGRLPSAAAAAAADADLLTLRNGDQLSGEVKTMTDTSIQVETAFGSLEIPHDRVERLVFRAGETRARRNRGDVRLTLTDGSKITLDLQKMEAGVFEGTSENVSGVRLPWSGVKRAEWNLYRVDRDTAGSDNDRDKDQDNDQIRQ
jgi:hypothetical protein